MAIKITKQSEPIKVDNIIITIYGAPGSGKTSLGFSANKPILFDFDNGVHRVKNRKDSIRISKWEEIENLTSDDLAPYQTIIIDTVGKMLETLRAYLVQKTPSLMKGGQFSPKGWGILGDAFKLWIQKIRSYKKDIVFIGHAERSVENEVVIYTLSAPGNMSKNYVYIESDLMGVLIQNSKGRTLDFGSTDSYSHKDCANFGLLNIPNLAENKTYLADLIQKAKDEINTLSEEYIQRQKEINEFKEQIEVLETAEDFTGYTLLEFVQKDIELKILLNTKAESKGFKYNKEAKQYEPTTLEK